MAIRSEFSFTSSNGKTQIHAVQWRPMVGVRGIIQLAHGMCDHICRYDEFANTLADHGFLVVGHDHIGHGESLIEPDLAGFCGKHGGWEIMVADVHKLHELTREKFNSVPYFLFGHSMGSFIARAYAVHYGKDLDGIILCGTAHYQRSTITMAKAVISMELRANGNMHRSEKLSKLIFGSCNKHFAPARTDFDWISSDTDVVDDYVSDPLCGYICTAAFYRDLADGIDFVTRSRNVRRIRKNMPVYFISGSADPIGEKGRSVIRAYRSFLDAGISDVTMKLYQGARHELLNESNRDEVYADVISWLEARL